ncbi:MAG: transposase [Candidatus Dormibacteria bacterium]
MLTTARTRQADPSWIADYLATRPRVERKLAHLMRRRHGVRRARVRGQVKVHADFSLPAAAANLARLGVLGLHSASESWAAVSGWRVAQEPATAQQQRGRGLAVLPHEFPPPDPRLSPRCAAVVATVSAPLGHFGPHLDSYQPLKAVLFQVVPICAPLISAEPDCDLFQAKHVPNPEERGWERT